MNYIILILLIVGLSGCTLEKKDSEYESPSAETHKPSILISG